MLSKEEKKAIKKIAELADAIPDREAYRLAGYGAALADMKEKQKEVADIEVEDGKQEGE